MEIEKDIDLIEGCKRRDRSAQKLLFKKFYSYVKSICVRYLDEEEEVTRTITASFLLIYDKIIFHKHGELLKDCIKKIVILKCHEYLKKKKSYIIKESNALELNNAADKANECDLSLTYEKLLVEIKSLPSVCRVVFNMYYIDGYNHYEIAELLELSVGIVKSNLNKGRDNISVKLSLNQKYLRHGA